ncbi:phage shock protein D [Yersinia pestis]|uniref:Peripheral inner membrane phage-shock protein n=11 Tax=Yersinia pseudotuberculosis complex TaxID=1649845 RepID=A0A3G5L6M2_YERPE|nr:MULTISPECIES: phage shock protein PspD [Yersinia pseudotuberculosis complex]ERP72334.1 phage-shock protein [Yersinia pestis S3]ERP73161.1 phage-shock protein [Yersinia pestis 24H]CQD49044.1 peripheral inner membrane phage-shock protein [Yersinia intermedia]AAM85549.1 phage shock protein [Yersinia pestis KIM10+]AAS62345.1 phage shock protein [Yersinia pestis biovar Microtus str. 91001]
MMNNNPAPTRAGVILTKLIKIMFTAALMYGPAGAASVIMKSVSYKPLRWLLLIILEPMLKRAMAAVASQFAKEKHETTAK